MANWFKILDSIRDREKNVANTVVTSDVVQPVVVQPVVTTDTTWLKIQMFYQKHKAKIWAVVWAVAAYLGSEYVNDAIDNLPSMKDVKAKVTSLEQRVDKIEKVLTPTENEQ
jgi:hypothetical protein